MVTIEKADLDFATLPFDYQKTDVNLRYRWRAQTWGSSDEDTCGRRYPLCAEAV